MLPVIFLTYANVVLRLKSFFLSPSRPIQTMKKNENNGALTFHSSHTCCRSKSVRPSLVEKSSNTSFFKILSIFSMVVANGITVHGCIRDSGAFALNKHLSNELIATVEGFIQMLTRKTLRKVYVGSLRITFTVP